MAQRPPGEQRLKTIVLEEPGRLRRTEMEPPGAHGTGEARVRVGRIGVCGTDVHAFRGRQPFFTYPRILGHELGVEVLEVGADAANVRPGDRCAVEPYLNCGTCIACRRDKPNCCETLRVLGVHTDGGMREEIIVPAAKLHRSDALTLDQLALVETLGIGAHAVDRALIEQGEFALVIGAGPIGLSVIQFAALAGAQIQVLDANLNRLEFASGQPGVEATMEPGENVLGRIRAACGGELPTVVFDATGNPQSMIDAFGYVANGGRLVFVGLVQADITFRDAEMHRREMSLIRTRNSTPSDFRRIIALIEDGRLDTSPWITHRAEFDDVVDRFPEWLDGNSGVIKAVIELD